MKKYVNLGMAVVIIAVFIFGITQKEKIIAEGDLVYLALAPVDPRSIMQGDYMRLRYEAAGVSQKMVDKPKQKTGFLVMDVDEKKVATFKNFLSGNEAISDDQILFKYQSNRYRVWLQPNSFLFQEGLRTTYAAAKYGIFRVSGDEHLLVGLADGDLKEIDPSAPKTN